MFSFKIFTQLNCFVKLKCIPDDGLWAAGADGAYDDDGADGVNDGADGVNDGAEIGNEASAEPDWTGAANDCSFCALYLMK